MNDKQKEGVWRWNSNDYKVTWFLWASNQGIFGIPYNEPNGEEKQNCAMMVKNFTEDLKRLTSSASWADVSCIDPQINHTSVVCQKRKGKNTSEIKNKHFTKR